MDRVSADWRSATPGLKTDSITYSDKDMESDTDKINVRDGNISLNFQSFFLFRSQ